MWVGLRKYTSLKDHGVVIARTCVRPGNREVTEIIAAGRNDHLVRAKSVRRVVFHSQRKHSPSAPVVVHEQVQRKVHNEGGVTLQGPPE